MIELHIELEKFSLEKALYCASLAKVKAAGFLCSDLTINAQAVKSTKKLLKELALLYDIEAFLGFKIAYVPPALIPMYTEDLRTKGFDYIAVHGENIYDNIAQGTNIAALNASVDILFHAGIIDTQLLEYAKEKDTAFEFNVHPYYSSANALLAQYAVEYNLQLIWGNTIKEEKDFIHSLRRKQHLAICPHAQENDLIKKLNQDTFLFMQKLSK